MDNVSTELAPILKERVLAANRERNRLLTAMLKARRDAEWLERKYNSAVEEHEARRRAARDAGV